MRTQRVFQTCWDEEDAPSFPLRDEKTANGMRNVAFDVGSLPGTRSSDCRESSSILPGIPFLLLNLLWPVTGARRLRGNETRVSQEKDSIQSTIARKATLRATWTEAEMPLAAQNCFLPSSAITFGAAATSQIELNLRPETVHSKKGR